MTNFTRRDLGKTLGAAAILAGGGIGTAEAKGHAEETTLSPQSFPKGFQWGCATASYQVEGAATEDGRGATNWDVFSHTPGKVANGDTGDVACDSYHRYAEDHDLLKNLGVGMYRMSIAWSRIFPEGRGTPNQKGVDHYKRVVDDLLAKGITPYVTMFHWDYPAALPGGWQNRDTALAFADYAGYMAGQLGDRVKHFMTTNEIRCFTDLSHMQGIHAPGLKLPPAGVNQVRHHGVLAHGLAVQAIRAKAAAGAQVGLAENPNFIVPAIETPEDIEAAKRATYDQNAMFLGAVMTGKYDEHYLATCGADAPKVQPGDMAAIGSPLDFVALNIYTPGYAKADPSAPRGYKLLPHPSSAPHMASPWLFVGPEVLYWGVRQVAELYKPKAIFISENGCSSDDKLVGGEVNDTDRVMYLRNYLTHLHRATAEGLPVKGYFLWSLMDNFEWADGYGKRFGIHYVDFATQKRTPKLSALWYKELIRRNALV
ncbi:GH1 family beta-glucosidase [Sphingomonas sp.]|uniref:GH1 family beta-glucosidase n=1 Tax=Sphingomonas sp. TaxID=28214 RepID=UPI001B1E8C44|nr:GH1 family beta-glucosidase [Sphingomonas sp.]MBO9714375.1 beta-glucosidase [Sphingomonas sp.]